MELSRGPVLSNPGPNRGLPAERASGKARHVPKRMIYPLLCVHEALLDCLESSDGRARAFLRAENTMKLVSVHRPDRIADLERIACVSAQKKNRPLVTVRETGPSSLLVLAEERDAPRFAPPCARSPTRREYPRAALMPAGWFSRFVNRQDVGVDARPGSVVTFAVDDGGRQIGNRTARLWP